MVCLRKKGDNKEELRKRENQKAAKMELVVLFGGKR